ncbi:M14 family zinc carboxypeptidase [Dokdonia sp.]|uniref:M14 family zinc carboxypeptidase n=1 Tax=Dokdonia sp. TaxID=2024995 RepID=UPI003266058A
MDTLFNWHKNHHEKQLFGRYIHSDSIADLLENLPSKFEIKQLGFSVEKRPIYSVTIGTGKTKILLWSQMHGNESTTTKAVFDLFKIFQGDELLPEIQKILSSCTLCFVPILNPDGASAFTRINANKVDLNRDAQLRSQPESTLLWDLYQEFKPDYCFNLHGQRTIFGFEKTATSSVLSFLAPSADESRGVTLSRKRSMDVIAHIYKELQPYLPEQIGRYDDGFNLNCTGDTFQANGTPTLLFEAGHYPEDYDREETRRYVFMALVAGLHGICNEVTLKEEVYWSIPEHQKCFCDILFTNTASGDIKIQYLEKLTNGKIVFIPQFSENKMTSSRFGHRVIDVYGQEIKNILTENVIGKVDISQINLDNGITITL